MKRFIILTIFVVSATAQSIHPAAKPRKSAADYERASREEFDAALKLPWSAEKKFHEQCRRSERDAKLALALKPKDGAFRDHLNTVALTCRPQRSIATRNCDADLLREARKLEAAAAALGAGDAQADYLDRQASAIRAYACAQ